MSVPSVAMIFEAEDQIIELLKGHDIYQLRDALDMDSPSLVNIGQISTQ